MWRMRSKAQYIETLHDCELVPNHTYHLLGDPVHYLQPQVCPTITPNPRPPNPTSLLKTHIDMFLDCTRLMHPFFRLNLRMQNFSILPTMTTTAPRLKSTWPGIRDRWSCAWRVVRGERNGCHNGCHNGCPGPLTPLRCGEGLSKSRVREICAKQFTSYFDG